jgi:hypothetical protein
MLLFFEYQRLPEHIKRMATQLWAMEVMYCCKATKVNQIPYKLEKELSIPGYAHRKQSQKFWYLKIDGQVMKSDSVFELIGKKYPSTIDVLLSPFWLLLSQTNLTKADVLRLSHRLSIEVKDRLHFEGKLFSNTGFSSTPSAHELELLMALLLILEWRQYENDIIELGTLEESVITHILVLFANRYSTLKSKAHDVAAFIASKLATILTARFPARKIKRVTPSFSLNLENQQQLTLAKDIRDLENMSVEEAFKKIAQEDARKSELRLQLEKSAFKNEINHFNEFFNDNDSFALPLTLDQLTTTEHFKKCLNIYKQITTYIDGHEHAGISFVWNEIYGNSPLKLALYLQRLNTEPIKVHPDETSRMLTHRMKQRYLN